MRRAAASSLCLAATSLVLAACRFEPPAEPVPGSSDTQLTPEDAAAPSRPRDAALPGRSPSLDAAAAVAVRATPPLAGCSDGTREAFLDLQVWPAIAGCAGAWTVPGVVGRSAVSPSCNRNSGDTDDDNAAGYGCAAADLCAVGWHVCRTTAEIDRRSPTGCEGAVPTNVPAFFAAAIGATPAGVCLTAPPPPTPPRAVNDLHGCGTLGQPEDERCAPLTRRMGFADCRTARAPWFCGDHSQWDQEASVVTKMGPSLGGVLCCRDLE